ncbi:hypothetical protein FPHYL_13995 [Fusarium phyllophilum]|uniref:Uncharacterized protein n=1 Tax=Fusarium phyllophilum TaxID=47803 RepID=A0A8H5I5R4_9HYPO|nr:hypothetical protein FPHYL_13995 [Fusarium phyllophilum]
MAKHNKESPDSSPHAPSINKSLIASRKVSPTEAPLPSPPDSAERACASAVALLQVLMGVLRELDSAPLNVDYYKSFPLSWEDFKSTCEVIEVTFRRFDYDPFKGQISIRMTTPIHDSFAGLLNKAVTDKLSRIKNGDNATARFAKSIVPVLTSRNYLDNRKRPALLVLDPEKKEQKSPDLQYCHDMAEYSGLVVEIAYTQPAKQLKKLASAYIRGSMGKIQTVIRFDLNSHKQSTPFRSADRKPLNQDRELELYLHNMTANKSLLEGVHNKSISIPFKDLCAFMNKVEKMQQTHEAEQEHDQIHGIPVKLTEPPSSSPEEQLASADERTFAEQETIQEKKAIKGDHSYPRRTREVDTAEPNVTTCSSSKRPAPTDTGADLHVLKRRPGLK